MKTDFRELKVELRDRIVRGTWPLGAALPNEVELAEEFNCARATVNRAMRELAEEGLLERKRKAGTRVRDVPRRQVTLNVPFVRHEIEALGARYRYSLLSSQILAMPDWLRAQMNVSADADVRKVQCVHYADGVPYMVEERWFNLTDLPEAESIDFSETAANEWLVAQVPFNDVEMSFSAQAADEDLARLLGCAAGDALFRTERTIWRGDRPLCFARLVYRQGYNLSARY